MRNVISSIFLIGLLSGPAMAADNVVTYCNCIDSSGPDLLLIALDATSGRELWKQKLAGWGTGDANWNLCWQRLEVVCKTVR